MHQPNSYAVLFQIEAEKFPNHIQCGLASMMTIVPSALLFVSQRDTPAFTADQYHFAPLVQQARFDEPLHYKDGANIF